MVNAWNIFCGWITIVLVFPHPISLINVDQTCPQGSGDPHLGVCQYPGGFFFFWVVIVPLSVLVNIRHFGLRKHELGLLVALNLNPAVLRIVMQSMFLNLLVALFLIIWIERILCKWTWYRIYSTKFLSNLVILIAFLAVPSLLLRMIWNHLLCNLPSALNRLAPSWGPREIGLQRDIIFLILAGVLLAYSVLLYINAQTRIHGNRQAKRLYHNRVCRKR